MPANGRRSTNKSIAVVLFVESEWPTRSIKQESEEPSRDSVIPKEEEYLSSRKTEEEEEGGGESKNEKKFEIAE